MVVEKQNPRTSKSTPGKLFRPMTLQDTEGFRVQAMTYGDEVELFGQRIELRGTYLISGAFVKAARDAARVPDPRYPNIWTLTRSTLLQPVLPADAIDVSVLGPSSLTPFSQFYDHTSDNSLIDAMVIVIHKLPRQWIIADKKKVVAAEFLIIDEECLPVVLTLWESFAIIQALELDYELRQGNFLVVHLQSVQYNLYQGFKLGTHYASAFDMAPTTERAVELNLWKVANVNVIRSMITDKTHLYSLIRLAKPLSKVLHKAADLIILHVTGNIVIPPGTDFGFYVGCGFCSGKINADEGIKHDCMHCGGKNAISVLRYKIGVNVTDETSYASAIMFYDEVDKLFSLCGVHIENGSVNLEILAQKLTGKTFIVD